MNILMSYICYDIAVPDSELIKALVTCKLQYQMIDSDAIDYRHCGEIRDFIAAFEELQERAYGNGICRCSRDDGKGAQSLANLEL